MNNAEFSALTATLRTSRAIKDEESFDLARTCSLLLSERNGSQAQGRDLAIRYLEYQRKFPESTRQLWNDVVEMAGLYPYVAADTVGLAGAIRKEAHRSEHVNDVYFHREQREVSNALLSGSQNVVLSAPTSFGKSLLIEEVVASRRFKNIVIIQPTLALLDETRKKMERYDEYYNIVVSTHQKYSTGSNIFLFTGERVVEYPDFPRIEFVVLDEFYKLSLDRDDERAVTLNTAVYRLLKFNPNFYFLGPSIRQITKAFLDRFNATWVHTTFATVAVDIEKPYATASWGKRKRDPQRAEALFEILERTSEPTLVFCSSQARTQSLAVRYFEKFSDGKATKSRLSKLTADLIEWIEKNIHPGWRLIELLQAGIAFHNGGLPRHLGSSIVDAFNRKDIRYLFCTTTLIEGVNTSARTVVLFDEKKGVKQIDFFDYKNISGRAGRMRQYFLGRVIQFHQEPQQLEIDVNIPLLEQDNAPLELLVQLEPDDLTDAGRRKLQEISGVDKDLMNVVKANKGLDVRGQLALAAEISADPAGYSQQLRWTRQPNYAQLSFAVDLCWRHLQGSSKPTSSLSPKQLATLALMFQRTSSLSELIREQIASAYWKNRIEDDRERVQAVVQQILEVSRNWFDYKLPKFLSTLSSIQRFVLTRLGYPAGNYSYFASLLEKSFVQQNISVLIDYDVPASAIRKLQPFVHPELEWPEVRKQLGQLDLNRIGLDRYEMEKISRLVRN